MIFKQYYLECLSHASYLVGDPTTGRAVVVDPQRDISEYLADASHHGLRIERVIETHFHADFVSGHLELAEATGAVISYGEAAQPEYDFDPLADGQRLSLGQVQLEILATPGHTPESISVVVYPDPDAPPYGVLTGDTLFIGDVGRPDLLTSVGVTAEELAERLYHSLHDKLLLLPDETKVYPAHGAGSACGKALSTETVSTIGAQRIENYALAPMGRERFIEVVTQGQSVAPRYFAFNATINKQVRDTMHDAERPVPLSWDDLVAAQAAGAIVLDTREATDFAAGHLRGAINVGLEGRFAEYTGAIVSSDRSIVIFAEPDTELEAKVRLGRIGFDQVVGYVEAPHSVLQIHTQQVSQASRITGSHLDSVVQTVPGLQLVDVRHESEYLEGSIDGAINVPLAALVARSHELDPARPTVVFCAGGYRSSIAASYLRTIGFDDVSDVLGGYGACAVLDISSP